MVDVDEVLAQVPVGFLEIESAALTDGTMMSDTGYTGHSTSFVGIDGYDLSGTFSVLFRNCVLQVKDIALLIQRVILPSMIYTRI
ncbi:hypothetical protein NS31R_20615 [Enterobacter cancerogenus]|nr:hypothetical protein NS31R_20615 [Enterobacter cancerogenus]